MITLEKLLTELKAESLNEIVAGGGRCGGGKGHGKSSKSARSMKSRKSARSKTDKSHRCCSCGC